MTETGNCYKKKISVKKSSNELLSENFIALLTRLQTRRLKDNPSFSFGYKQNIKSGETP